MESGSRGLDVYANEACLFYNDHADHLLTDATLALIIDHPNVLITGSQRFSPHDAFARISDFVFGGAYAHKLP